MEGFYMKRVLLLLFVLVSTATVYTAQAQVSFANPVQYKKLGQDPVHMVSADFDGNNTKDLAVVSNESWIYVLSGNGDGTFAAAKTYIVSSKNYHSIYLAAADFNNDGHIDLAVCSNGDSVSVLLNSGTGTFPSHKQYFVGGMNGEIAVADFDKDGYMDITASSTDALDLNYQLFSVLINQKNGTFKTEVDYPVSSNVNGHYIGAGDYNGDTYQDIIIPLDMSDSIVVYLNKGDGTFPDSLPIKSAYYPGTPIVRDFNQDGKADIFSGGTDASYNPKFSFIFNEGGGKDSLLLIPIENVNYYAGPAVGDFNNDNIPDFVMSERGSNSPDTLMVLLNTGNFKLASPIKMPVIEYSGFILPDDFNGDGKQDIAITNFADSSISVILQKAASSTTTPVISSVNPNNEIKIYPNPVSSTLNIAATLNASEEARITMYDQVGKVVWNYSGPLEAVQYDVSGLTKGIYLLRVEGDSITSGSFKVVVE